MKKGKIFKVSIYGFKISGTFVVEQDFSRGLLKKKAYMFWVDVKAKQISNYSGNFSEYYLYKYISPISNIPVSSIEEITF